jgi:nitrous oxide reductase accessory protein NosL
MRVPLLFLLCLLISSSLFAETPEGLDDKSRCEVCGMFVAPYPNWVAVIEMTDGRRFYFDGPKDLFIFFSDLAHYQPDATYEQVKNLYVTEYYTSRTVNATDVFFVAGSDVRGPMGMELVPVAGREAAETFLRDHAGSKLMQFDGHELRDVKALK